MSPYQRSTFRPDHLAPEAEITGAALTSRPELEAQLLTVGRLLYQERVNNDILEKQLSARTFDYSAWQSQKAQFDRLTTYIHFHYRREIMSGAHAERTLSQIVEKYLNVERRRWRVRLANWWWNLTGKDGD